MRDKVNNRYLKFIICLEEGGKIFYRSNLTSDIDNMVDKRLCTESLINCLIWQRAVNLASVWLDFEDNYFVK